MQSESGMDEAAFHTISEELPMLTCKDAGFGLI